MSKEKIIMAVVALLIGSYVIGETIHLSKMNAVISDMRSPDYLPIEPSTGWASKGLKK